MPQTPRNDELARLRSLAMDDSALLMDRVGAMMDRMHLVDDILTESIREETQSREDIGP